MREILESISFRPLVETDIPLVWDWLNDDYVSHWYHHEKTFELQQIKLLNCINGTKPTKAFIVQFDAKDIGYIQCYRNADYPDYQKEIDFYDNVCGIDMFIGDKDYLHRGIGPMMVLKFLHTIAFPQLATEACVLGPDPKNQSAIKAYSKVGFSHIKTCKTNDGEEYLMIVTQEQIQDRVALLLYT